MWGKESPSYSDTRIYLSVQISVYSITFPFIKLNIGPSCMLRYFCVVGEMFLFDGLLLLCIMGISNRSNTGQMLLNRMIPLQGFWTKACEPDKKAPGVWERMKNFPPFLHVTQHCGPRSHRPDDDPWSSFKSRMEPCPLPGGTLKPFWVQWGVPLWFWNPYHKPSKFTNHHNPSS